MFSVGPSDITTEKRSLYQNHKSRNQTLVTKILFDIMETLVVEPFFSAIPSFFGLTLEELLAEKHPTSWIEFEKGTIDEGEYLATFFKDGRAIDGEGLRRRLYETYDWMDGMQAIVAELHAAKVPMYALSNYSTWYLLIEERLQLSRYLDWSFVSCRMGVRKPDADAYLIPARQMGVAPEDCLFVDDRQVNVDAAKALGIDTILMQDANQVRGELVARGLLRS